MRLCASLLLLALSASAVGAEAQHTYIVRLSDPPLVEHARQVVQQTGMMRSLGERAALRRQITSDDSVAYLRHLDAAREQVLTAGRSALGRTLQPRHVFRH